VNARRLVWIWGAAWVALAIALRLAWVLSVRTVPVSDFAMYRESANYLSEFGHLDPGFIYMPGFVALLAWIKDAGGGLVAQKLAGVAFGGLGAAGLFVLAYKLLDEDAAEAPRVCPCPRASVATALYAVWPAGVAMSSVVGTDVPAAALVVAALAALAALGPRRPWAAALAFGATMGLAAWVRAVALPLTVLALGYWLARRERLLRAAALTAAGVATTALVLLPWGIHHLRESGDFYLTDDHGGITALIGANPNSEGTYTRALNALFKDVSGRSVLDQPHRATDRAASAMAREWLRFEPGYTLGMAILKAERLFDPEQRLLYWPVLRNGVLVGRQAAFVAGHRQGIGDAADAIGLGIAALALAGAAIALARRRWTLLALLPFQLALAATYTIFFAEPRYRMPIEMLAFPFAAVALVDGAGALVALLAAAVRRDRARAAAAGVVLGAALAALVAWRLLWPVMIDWGAALRARHRWAVTEVDADGQKRLLLWKPAPPLAPASPLAGAPNGVHVRLADRGRATARVALGGGDLPAGRYALALRADAEAALPVHVALGDASADVPAGGSATLQLPLIHAGGPLTLTATVEGPPGASAWLSEVTIRELHEQGGP
jgi:hypothetical protein